MDTKTLVHTSALVVIPPEVAWEPIQAIRRQHDPKIERWMPHFTLFYPFVAKEDFPEVVAALTEPLKTVKRFSLKLSRFGHFNQRRGRFVIWLGPESETEIAALHACLQSALQGLLPQTKARAFKPHMTVARGQGKGRGQRLLQDLSADWENLDFEVGKLALIARGPDSPFEVQDWLELA